MKSLMLFTSVLFAIWCGLYIYSGKENKITTFLDMEHTNILKGYAIFFVLVGHVGQYAGVNGIEYPAGVGVSLFLILSGYGITLSVEKHGLSRYWKKRILRVFVPYILAETVYMLIARPNRNIVDIILDFTLLKPTHPFGWYLHYILICYILFYIVNLLIKNYRYRMIGIGILFAGWFLVKSVWMIDETPFLQARQMLAFPLGMLLATKKSGGGQKWNRGYGFCLLLLSTGMYGILHTAIMNVSRMPLVIYNFLSLWTCVVCALGIIVLTYYVRLLQNHGMTFVAIVSYEIYIVHGYFVNQIEQSNFMLGIIEFVVLTMAGTVFLYSISKKIQTGIKTRGGKS